MERWSGVKELRACKSFDRSGDATTGSHNGVSIHVVHLMVRPASFGVAGGCGDGASFGRQRHIRASDDVPQQHDAAVAQTAAGLMPPCSMQGPTCAIGASPVAAMTTSVISVVATFSFLHGLRMALHPRTIDTDCSQRRRHCLGHQRTPPSRISVADVAPTRPRGQFQPSDECAQASSPTGPMPYGGPVRDSGAFGSPE